MNDNVSKALADLNNVKSELEELRSITADIKSLKSKALIDCAEKIFDEKVTKIIASIDTISNSVSLMSDTKPVPVVNEFKYKYIDYIDSLTDSIIPHALLPLDATASAQNVLHIKKIIREYDKTNKVISEDPALASACPNYNIIFSKIYDKINSKLRTMPVVPETKIEKSPEYPEYTNPCNIDEFREMIDSTVSMKDSDEVHTSESKNDKNTTKTEKNEKSSSKKSKHALKKQVKRVKNKKISISSAFGL